MSPINFRTDLLPSANVGCVPGTHRRIVAVQGAVQLVSALAAMRLSDRQQTGRACENHLIVHDLSAPANQADAFAACLHGLASQAAPWASMRYLPLTEMLRFQEALKIGSWEAATRTLRETLTFDGCQELLLGQNLLFINNLLCRSFPSAETACYGDGVGLNFTSDYYVPGQDQRPGLRAIERWIRMRIKMLRGQAISEPSTPTKSKKHAVPFNKHYLLLANQFDQQLAQYEQLSAADFTELFTLFSTSLPQFAEATCRTLESALSDAQQVIVLLTSNFSETKRMTLEGEVTCCMEMVLCRQRSKRALLVIKPHPRDALEKIQALEKVAQKSFQAVVTLTDPWTFFIPFETVFQRYFAANPRISQCTSVVCSSSACISLELLFGQHCELGFGAKNVRRHFSPKWQELRVRHEADLIRLVQRIRKSGVTRLAA